jgi:hypothetical protein
MKAAVRYRVDASKIAAKVTAEFSKPKAARANAPPFGAGVSQTGPDTLDNQATL